MMVWIVAGLFPWEEAALPGSPRLMANTLARLHPDAPLYYLDPVHLLDASQVLRYRTSHRGPLWHITAPGAAEPASTDDHRRLAAARPLVLYSTSYHHVDPGSWMSHLRPEVWVYNVLENAVILDGPALARHQRVLREAQHVVSNSAAVTQSLAGRVDPSKVLEWGMAVDTTFWHRGPAPPRWTFGFFGHLMPWIDYDAVEHLAEAMPQDPVVLIGPVHGASQARLAALCRRCANVQWIGAQPYERLPELTRSIEVMLLPRVSTPLSDACDPVKLYEYLAAGKPVATTFPVSAAVAPFVHHGTSHEFVACCQAALGDARRGHGRHTDRLLAAFLATRSWTARTEAIWTTVGTGAHAAGGGRSQPH